MIGTWSAVCACIYVVYVTMGFRGFMEDAVPRKRVSSLETITGCPAGSQGLAVGGIRVSRGHLFL